MSVIVVIPAVSEACASHDGCTVTRVTTRENRTRNGRTRSMLVTMEDHTRHCGRCVECRRTARGLGVGTCEVSGGPSW